MKNLIKIIITAIVLSSCSSRTQVEKKLDVLVCSEIEMENNFAIPEILRSFYTPITESRCDSLFFSFSGKVFKVDDTDNMSVEIKFVDDWMSKVQKQITKQTPEMLDKQMNRYLDQISLKNISGTSITKEIAYKKLKDYLIINSKSYNTILVYTDKSDTDTKLFETYPVFRDMGGLRDTIAEISCNQNEKKILVLYNPPFSIESTEATFQTTVSSDSIVKERITTTQETIKTTTTKDVLQISASSLEECFKKLADPTIKYSQKDNLKKKAISYFTDNDAQVVKMNNGEPTKDGVNDIKRYVESLTSTYHKVTIVNKELSGEKISKIYIQES